MGALLVIAVIAIVAGFLMKVFTDTFASLAIFWIGILLVIIAIGGRLVGLL